MIEATLDRFASDYAAHRAAEGRIYTPSQLFQLPYLKSGPLAAQWAVRARSFEAFIEQVVRPVAHRLGRPLELLDLGAGNAWLSHRLVAEGHRAFALDIRNDTIDGLGAAAPLLRRFPQIECLIAPFERIPLPPESADIAVFNASLHYATDLAAVLKEARRVTRPGGRIVVLDSPFYPSEADGLAMVTEKQRQAEKAFGARAESLMALPFIEFLTRERLEAASPALRWERHRVRYPLGYELRPLVAALLGRRTPSRFDMWVAERP